MFPYTCGYFPDKHLKFLSLKFAPKVMLGCIISNCGTQASKKVCQQISIHSNIDECPKVNKLSMVMFFTTIKSS